MGGKRYKILILEAYIFKISRPRSGCGIIFFHHYKYYCCVYCIWMLNLPHLAQRVLCSGWRTLPPQWSKSPIRWTEDLIHDGHRISSHALIHLTGIETITIYWFTNTYMGIKNMNGFETVVNRIQTPCPKINDIRPVCGRRFRWQVLFQAHNCTLLFSLNCVYIRPFSLSNS